MPQIGQIYFKNLAANAARFLKCVWPFWDMHYRSKTENLLSTFIVKEVINGEILESFTKLLFRNKQVHFKNITFHFLETFFRAPILVNWYVFALGRALVCISRILCGSLSKMSTWIWKRLKILMRPYRIHCRFKIVFLPEGNRQGIFANVCCVNPKFSDMDI